MPQNYSFLPYFAKKFLKNLHNSKITRTFALAFEKYTFS